MPKYHAQKKLRRREDNRGAILLVVLMVMVVLIGLGMTGLFLTSGSVQMSGNITMRNQALVVAEAGIERARQILNYAPATNPNWLPAVEQLLQGQHPSGGDEIPTSADQCSGLKPASGTGIVAQKRGAILVDTVTTGCTSGTPCKLAGVDYPRLVNYDETVPGLGTPSRSTMGKYTVYIRQDQADCRMSNYTCDNPPLPILPDGGVADAGVTPCTPPVGAPTPNGALVVRSEGVASDGRTLVVLEATLAPAQSLTVQTNATLSALCANGANGCEDNSGVQNGITVNSPVNYGGAGGAGGAGGSGGSGGSGGTSSSGAGGDGGSGGTSTTGTLGGAGGSGGTTTSTGGSAGFNCVAASSTTSSGTAQCASLSKPGGTTELFCDDFEDGDLFNGPWIINTESDARECLVTDACSGGDGPECSNTCCGLCQFETATDGTRVARTVSYPYSAPWNLNDWHGVLAPYTKGYPPPAPAVGPLADCASWLNVSPITIESRFKLTTCEVSTSMSAIFARAHYEFPTAWCGSGSSQPYVEHWYGLAFKCTATGTVNKVTIRKRYQPTADPGNNSQNEMASASTTLNMGTWYYAKLRLTNQGDGSVLLYGEVRADNATPGAGALVQSVTYTDPAAGDAFGNPPLRGALNGQGCTGFGSRNNSNAFNGRNNSISVDWIRVRTGS